MTLKIKDKKLLCHLKSKIKKIVWTKLYYRQFYNEKILITWGLFVDKGSESGSGIFQNVDPGDQKRPDPTGSGSGSATLLITLGAGGGNSSPGRHFYNKKLITNVIFCIYL